MSNPFAFPFTVVTRPMRPRSIAEFEEAVLKALNTDVAIAVRKGDARYLRDRVTDWLRHNRNDLAVRQRTARGHVLFWAEAKQKRGRKGDYVGDL